MGEVEGEAEIELVQRSMGGIETMEGSGRHQQDIPFRDRNPSGTLFKGTPAFADEDDFPERMRMAEALMAFREAHRPQKLKAYSAVGVPLDTMEASPMGLANRHGHLNSPWREN
jgi:hypothetical protein